MKRTLIRVKGRDCATYERITRIYFSLCVSRQRRNALAFCLGDTGFVRIAILQTLSFRTFDSAGSAFTVKSRPTVAPPNIQGCHW